MGFLWVSTWAAQGAPLIYLVIIWWYARYMNGLDRRYGVREGEGDDD
jgi:putative solute:sodium symporter small subunit